MELPIAEDSSKGWIGPRFDRGCIRQAIDLRKRKMDHRQLSGGAGDGRRPAEIIGTAFALSIQPDIGPAILNCEVNS